MDNQTSAVFDNFRKSLTKFENPQPQAVPDLQLSQISNFYEQSAIESLYQEIDGLQKIVDHKSNEIRQLQETIDRFQNLEASCLNRKMS